MSSSILCIVHSPLIKAQPLQKITAALSLYALAVNWYANLNGYSYYLGLSVYPEFVAEVFSLISGDGKTVWTRYRSCLDAMP